MGEERLKENMNNKTPRRVEGRYNTPTLKYNTGESREA